VADRRRHHSPLALGRDARLGRASLPFSAPCRLLAAAVLLLLSPASGSRAGAQAAPRPWLDWRTAETEHFVFHYPTQYREWTLALAERIEGVRTQVSRVVGYAPDERVHIVIDDPSNEANGYAFTTLDAPTIVLWPTPPDPRSEIGNARVWEELLATHEFAHVAHLTRPSRNRWQRLLRSLAPLPLGPIATKAPRWVLEGYATYVEGRVTGTGRPNNAWRAAIIRQFALEGKLPSYAQLSATGGWETGSFAYLLGSAYLEWLARREGDSSIVALWRRMTAVTDRSFDAAFSGVYGLGPAELYGRFAAEVTADALAVERSLRREGVVEGALVQRLTRSTGDPAISPDGRYVALTVRRTDAPDQVVVWRTADEPDTVAERRRERERARDPEDVPDRAFFPPPKQAVLTLVASAGAAYETPRWFTDGKRLLLTRRTPLGDGTLRPDLYVWNADDGSVRRLTHGAALRDADPSPDGAWAAAVRCDQGWCDLVRVDLATGAVRVLRRGTVSRNYYRPRVSRTTGEIVVAEQWSDRWRIARVASETGALRYADPDDGVTRYDAAYAADGRTVVTTSERGGIANLERLDSASAQPMRLTSITGAAVAAEVAPDGSVWFLALQGNGYDLRRLASDTVPAPPPPATALALADSLSPVLPPVPRRATPDSVLRPERDLAPRERAYGSGPSRFRYFPASTSGVGGTTTQLALVRSDPVGRLGIVLVASAGAASLPEGLGLTVTSRASRPELVASGWLSHEAPSREYHPALAAGLDLARAGGALRVEDRHVGDGWEIAGALALLAEGDRPAGLADAGRRSALLAMGTTLRQRDEEVRYQEQLSVLGEAGRTLGGAYLRQRAALFFGTASGPRPLASLRLEYGTIGGGGGIDREQFAVGGFGSPLIDPMYDARRVDAPAYPLASAVGNSFASYHATLPLALLDLFYRGVSTDYFRHPLRSYGAEIRERVPAIAALGTPEVDVLTGVARAVDEPAKGRWRYYVTLGIRP
jgi:hypothetical protein